MGASLVLSACSSNRSNGKESAAGNEGTVPETQQASPGNEKKYVINLYENGWVNSRLSQDPWKKWADERYNVDFRLTAIAGSDLEQKLLVAYASQEQPDLVFSWSKNTIEKLYAQGVLVDDYTPYLDKLPTMAKHFNDGTKAFTSKDGKMIMLPLAPDKNRWTVQIRKDWLANLGMKEPTTDQELFEYLKAVTFDDPDRNGKNDTYGTTAAGTGKDLSLFSQFEYMYGPSGWYVDDQGNVNNSILDGTHQKMLEFVKKLSDEKVLDPDWYTQDWGKLGTKVHGEKVGMIWYPSRELINEADTHIPDKDILGYWEPIVVPQGSAIGGKLGPDPITGGVYAISASTASDPGKMERVLQILEDAQYPNEGYYGFRWGVGVPGVDQKIQETQDGLSFINMKDDFRQQPGNNAGLDYGAWANFNGTDPLLEISEAEPGDLTKTWVAAENKVKTFPKYRNYNDLLNLDIGTVANLKKLQDEFDIKFIVGRDNDYEAFKTAWLKNGGEQLLADAALQFKAAGVIP